MRAVVDKRSLLLIIGLVLAMGFIVPSSVMGAGDDCPPPTEGPPNDPGVDNPSSGNDPTGNEETDPTTDEGGTSDDGLFGSLGGATSSQLTLGVVVIVGVIVGVAYLVLVSRMDD